MGQLFLEPVLCVNCSMTELLTKELDLLGILALPKARIEGAGGTSLDGSRKVENRFCGNVSFGINWP